LARARRPAAAAAGARVAARAQKAVGQSRQAEAAGVLPPAQALAYQRALLDALALITLKRQELTSPSASSPP